MNRQPMPTYELHGSGWRALIAGWIMTYGKEVRP